jgi:hypothetical protein
MQPILDLPTSLILSMQSTHDKHQSAFPNFDILQHFDLSMLVNFVKLEKPINSAVYREINLSINLMEFIRVRERIWHIQHERQQLINSFKILGSFCAMYIDRSS